MTACGFQFALHLAVSPYFIWHYGIIEYTKDNKSLTGSGSNTPVRLAASGVQFPGR